MLEYIYLTLVLIERVSDVLDLASLVLDDATIFANTALEGLSISALLELNESLLLVDCLTLLLDSILELGASVICIISIVSVVLFTIGLGSGLLGLFSSVLESALSRCSAQLILLKLSEGLGIGLNLSLDRLNVLLRLAILHPYDREDLTYLS